MDEKHRTYVLNALKLLQRNTRTASDKYTPEQLRNIYDYVAHISTTVLQEVGELTVSEVSGDASDAVPRFQHDSTCCTFLGHFDGHDLYFCAQGENPTVIARFGDDGQEYMSGMHFAFGQIKHLTEARHRALERGLIKD